VAAVEKPVDVDKVEIVLLLLLCAQLVRVESGEHAVGKETGCDTQHHLLLHQRY